MSDAEKSVDDLLLDAARHVVARGKASAYNLQAKLSIGHPRAMRLIRKLEERGIIGPFPAHLILCSSADVEKLLRDDA
jgi:DNA segregation ATPase FtsK/SpoIIIE-like protein